MSATGYRFERFDPARLDEVSALRAAVFSGTPEENRAYIQWKYFDNPFLDDLVMHVATYDDAIVGVRGWYGGSWVVPGEPEPVEIPAIGEVAVAEDHRGIGMFTDLVTYAVDDVMARGYWRSMGVSATPQSKQIGLHFGWKWVANYDTLIRRRPRTRVDRVKRRLGLDGRDTLARIDEALASRRWVQDPMGEVDYDAVASVNRATPNDGIHHRKDAMALAWRLANPMMQYRIIMPSRRDPSTFVILQSSGGSTIRILDFGGDPSTVEALLGEVFDAAPDAPIQIWGAWLPPSITSYLSGQGFVRDDTELERGLLVRAYSGNDEDFAVGSVVLTDPEAWGLRMFGSDRY